MNWLEGERNPIFARADFTISRGTNGLTPLNENKSNIKKWLKPKNRLF